MNVFAKKIKINSPQSNPVIGETFSVEFIVTTTDSTEPEIDFDVIGLDVVSKSPGSYTSRTTFINGKYSSISTMSYSYEFVAEKSGFAYIRKISVIVDGEKVKHSSIKFNVLKQARKTGDIFAKVHLSKSTAYVGESVIVRYYLYNKSTTPVNSSDIKKFPKLNKLLKRYHQEKTRGERVRVNGIAYTRRVIYTAQVFAENAGEYKIDPIAFRISYSKSNNSYNNFGFGLRLGRQSVKTVRSKREVLEIIDLPGEGVPDNFSGLVGKHEFTLKINKNKFLVNEPIEIKLEIDGPGALELYEPPSILLNDNLEEFEKNTDLSVNANFTAKKKMEYTYLGRDGTKIKETKIPMSYFDPELKKYVSKDILINSILIAGVGSKEVIRKANSKLEQKINKPEKSILIKSRFTPLYKTMSSFVYHAQDFLKYLITFFVFCIIYIMFRLTRNREVKEETLLNDILRNGITYSKWHRFFARKNDVQTISEIINELNLSTKAQEYFTDLNNKLTMSYKEGDTTSTLKVNKRLFKEVSKEFDANS
jgi:hypothetical protein